MRYYKIEVSGSGQSTPTPDVTSGEADLGEITLTTDNGVTDTGPGGPGTGTPTTASPPSSQFVPNNEGVKDVGVDLKGANATTTPATGRDITVHKSGGAAPSATQATDTWTSIANGENDPGALDIQFTIELKAGNSQAPTSAHIQIFGIPMETVSQSKNFNNKTLKMWAGYTNGLPLANEQVPHQGLLIHGNIFPAFGNWILNNLSVDFIVTPLPADQDSGGGTGGPTDPKNIVHNMPENTPLSQSMQQTLKTAFPGAEIFINISDKIKLAVPDYSFHQSIEQYESYVKALSHSILGTTEKTGYAGVSIARNGNKISVTDGTKKAGPIQINYNDIIGQPTWIAPNTIQVTTVLRGDLGLNSQGTTQITLPKMLTTMTEEAAKWASATPEVGGVLTFQGTWDVMSVKHIGHFRDPQWNAWITVIEASNNTLGTSSSANTPGTPAQSEGDVASGSQTFTPSGAAPGASGGIGRQ